MSLSKLPDALTWLKTHTVKPSSRFWFFFIVGFPVISHIVGRILKQKWWLNDFDALICGADYLRRGISPYAASLACPGLKAPPYVYAPQVGEAIIPIIQTFGLLGTKALYIAVLVPALALMIWYALKRPFANLPLHLRVVAYTVVSGSALTCGNIVVIFHAAALWAALNLHKSRWPFLLVVLVGTLIKPIFLTYLILFIYQNKPVRERLAFAFTGAVIGIASYILITKTAGPFYSEWQNAIYNITLIEQPGYSFFSWAGWIGLAATSPVTLISFAFYFAILSLCGLLICEIKNLSFEMRVLIGLGMAQLLNPRMMSYDMIYLPTIITGIIMVTQDLPGRSFWRLSWIITIIGGASFILANAPIQGIKPADVVSPLFVCIIGYATYIVVKPRFKELKAALSNPVKILSDAAKGNI
ncbi:hypothetical protein OVA03_03770 [Asticcacaulis sp. SL142]|uniref:hypothetical protein n=1 Tax=Asticcacaulis sp. SL142 TaxID=2995155 RepID=UPI00226CE694|nr:hypothetical protein [Asticcacaulis sp. SL142]WAC49045.1 hypothetical protein OVA03_03770 [Asticcacaulis sp. SL142]